MDDLEILRSLAHDPGRVGPILEEYRPRLRTMIDLRLDARLRARIDGSDVLQEAFLEATERLPEYLDRPEVPFFVWVRFLTGQKIHEIHRRHFERQIRDVRRELQPCRWGAPEASSVALASAFIDRGLSPSEHAVKKERIVQLTGALEALKDIDREVVVLRHFEGLTNNEVAQVLRISKPGASLRYVRAMRRLGRMLLSAGGDSEPSKEESRSQGRPSSSA